MLIDSPLKLFTGLWLDTCPSFLVVDNADTHLASIKLITSKQHLLVSFLSPPKGQEVKSMARSGSANFERMSHP